MFETCTIRSVTTDDLPLILSWRNHPNVRNHMFTQHEISLEEHARWFAEASRNPERKLLLVEEHGDPLGYVQFSGVARGGVAHWGFYARPEASRGSGTKLGVCALNHAFRIMELHKVCGQAIETNKASIEFHKKLGFKQEGALREHQRINEAYHTLICFGLLAQEWQSSHFYQEKRDAED